MSSCDEILYIEQASTLQERISRIDQIITSLELRLVDDAVNTSNIDEYTLNDGQVQIKTKYRDVESIAKAINEFEKLKHKYINRLNGRGMVLRPWQGL